MEVAADSQVVGTVESDQDTVPLGKLGADPDSPAEKDPAAQVLLGVLVQIARVNGTAKGCLDDKPALHQPIPSQAEVAQAGVARCVDLTADVGPWRSDVRQERWAAEEQL